MFGLLGGSGGEGYLNFYGGAGFVGFDFQGAAELGELLAHAENADAYNLVPGARISIIVWAAFLFRCHGFRG
jgi:hypothetical protein